MRQLLEGPGTTSTTGKWISCTQPYSYRLVFNTRNHLDCAPLYTPRMSRQQLHARLYGLHAVIRLSSCPQTGIFFSTPILTMSSMLQVKYDECIIRNWTGKNFHFIPTKWINGWSKINSIVHISLLFFVFFSHLDLLIIYRLLQH